MKFKATTDERKQNFDYVFSLIPEDRNITISEILATSSLTLSQIKPYLETLCVRGEIIGCDLGGHPYYFRKSFQEARRAEERKNAALRPTYAPRVKGAINVYTPPKL